MSEKSLSLLDDFLVHRMADRPFNQDGHRLLRFVAGNDSSLDCFGRCLLGHASGLPFFVFSQDRFNLGDVSLDVSELHRIIQLAEGVLEFQLKKLVAEFLLFSHQFFL
jgi:hypothetical protein